MFLESDCPQDSSAGGVWSNEDVFWYKICLASFQVHAKRCYKEGLVQNQSVSFVRTIFVTFGLLGLYHGWSFCTTKLKGLFSSFPRALNGECFLSFLSFRVQCTACNFFLSACNARCVLSIRVQCTARSFFHAYNVRRMTVYGAWIHPSLWCKEPESYFHLWCKEPESYFIFGVWSLNPISWPQCPFIWWPQCLFVLFCAKLSCPLSFWGAVIVFVLYPYVYST